MSKEIVIPPGQEFPSQAAWEAMVSASDRNQLSLEQCEKLAQRVAAALPPTFCLSHTATHHVGTQHHHIAFFAWRKSVEHPPCFFALIPGGTVTLGYDRTQHLFPDEELIRDWQEKHLYFHGHTVTDSHATHSGIPDSLTVSLPAAKSDLTRNREQQTSLR